MELVQLFKLKITQVTKNQWINGFFFVLKLTCPTAPNLTPFCPLLVFPFSS
jgi:hypothetical protein